MEYNDIKLIATDMDGTFLDSNKEFDKEFVDLFYKLKEKGIKFVVASGQQYYRLYQRFIPMSEHMYFIAENGSYIAEGANELYCNVMDSKKVDKVREVISNYPYLVIVMCGKKGAYILKDHFDLRNEIKKYYCCYSFVDSFEDVDDEIMKLSIYDPYHQVKELYHDVLEELPPHLRLVTSGNEWMDISNDDIHKGIGIKFLQMIYDLMPEECVAFGDQMNDLEMLKSVKYAFAMENAVGSVKEVAYQVIDSNENQGVIKKIKEIIGE